MEVFLLSASRLQYMAWYQSCHLWYLLHCDWNYITYVTYTTRDLYDHSSAL